MGEKRAEVEENDGGGAYQRICGCVERWYHLKWVDALYHGSKTLINTDSDEDAPSVFDCRALLRVCADGAGYNFGGFLRSKKRHHH